MLLNIREKPGSEDEFEIFDFFCMQRTHARKLSWESIDAGLAGPQIQAPLTRNNKKEKYR